MMKRALLMLPLVVVLAAGCGGTAWKSHSSAEGRFKAEFPGTPKEKSESLPDGGTMKMVLLEDKDLAYTVSYFDLPGLSEDEVSVNAEAMEEFLNEKREGSLKGMNGTLISENKIKLEDKWPGRYFVGDLPDKKIQVRCNMYVVGDRIYMVMVGGPKDKVNSADGNKFLNSFALTK